MDTQVVRKSGRDAIAGPGTLSEPIESLDPYVRVIRAPTSSAVGPGWRVGAEDGVRAQLRSQRVGRDRGIPGGKSKDSYDPT